MEKFKRAYYYLFYKFYKMSEAAPAKWLSDWKAGIVIIALELFFISSILNYYVYFIDKTAPLGELSNLTVIICVLIVIIPNYFLFVHTEKWKDYVKEFEALPIEINKKGSWIVFAIVLFVIVNLIFSFYLYYQT